MELGSSAGPDVLVRNIAAELMLKDAATGNRPIGPLHCRRGDDDAVAEPGWAAALIGIARIAGCAECLHPDRKAALR